MGNITFQKALETIESLPEEQRESLMGRQVPRKPRLLGGIKGHNKNEISSSGSPALEGVELHIVRRPLIEERRDRMAQSIKEAREEYKRGKIRKGTIDDLMNELSK